MTTAREDYPELAQWAAGHFQPGVNDAFHAFDEIDRWRGYGTQVSALMLRQNVVIEEMIQKVVDLVHENHRLKIALGDQTNKASRYKRHSKELRQRLEAERQGRDREVRDRIMKAGLKQGRREAHEELVDRKGEPLPTAREIMDKVAAERKVNYDGSRVIVLTEADHRAIVDASVAQTWAVGLAR